MADVIGEVLASGMCAGCGLCSAQPDQMDFDQSGFLRPLKHSENDFIQASCPGKEVWHKNDEAPYHPIWGPIVSANVSFATDEKLRYVGSSGGGISALLCMLLKRGSVDAIIQVGADEEKPLLNSVKIHSSPDEVLRNAGSRYAPSAPLSIVQSLEGDDRRFAFVGKPCDVAALRRLISLRPELKSRFTILISFFCAGVPSQRGTEALLKRLGMQAEEVVSFQYRGNGWPGMTRAESRTGEVSELTYNESWGTILNKHLQTRCKICADGSGEAADIVCADAWESSEGGYPSFDEAAGRSLTLARTKLGQEILDIAGTEGYLNVQPYDISDLAGIQPYQVNRKRAILSRKLALMVTFGRTPRFGEHALLDNARRGGLVPFFKSFLATLSRRFRGRI